MFTARGHDVPLLIGVWVAVALQFTKRQTLLGSLDQVFHPSQPRSASVLRGFLRAADTLFNSAGRFVVRDQGAITIIFRLFLKAFDVNLFWSVFTYTHATSNQCF